MKAKAAIEGLLCAMQCAPDTSGVISGATNLCTPVTLVLDQNKQQAPVVSGGATGAPDGDPVLSNSSGLISTPTFTKFKTNGHK